jgi:hypothetical protein
MLHDSKNPHRDIFIEEREGNRVQRLSESG